MTSMPDLQSTGRAPAPPAAAVSPPRSETPVVEPVLPVLEPQIETEENRAEARRLTADRYEAEIQQRTAEGLRDAITDTRRRLGPELIEMGRAYEEPPGLNAREEEALAEDRLDAAERVASRTRVAAARLTAMRIAMQENAVRAAESAWTDAQELARINGELTADEPPTDARRTELRARQRQLVDGLVETTGASARENADGSVDLLLGDRALVRGDQAEPLVVTRPATLPTTGGSTTSPAPTAPAETPPTPRGVDDGTDAPPPASITTLPPSPSRPEAAPERPVATPLPGAPERAAGSSGSLEVTWADGTPAPVGGRLGGYVGADRVVMRPAIAEFDAVAAKIAEAVNTAQQTGATSSGTPGAPVLQGDSALTLRVAEGVTAADIAAGGSWPVEPFDAAAPSGTVQLASPVTTAPVSAVPATPEAALAALEDRATDLVGAAARRAGVVNAFDVSLGLASARLGQNVSASLGAIGDVRSSDLVATLHQANSAMAFAGAAARRAEATGIPVLVGTSDPTVATATGAMALDATGPAMLRLDVLSVAGQPIPSTPGAVPGDAALAQPGVSGSPLVGVGADATPVVSGVVLPGVTGPDLEAGTASTPGAGVPATGGGQTTALPGAGVPVGADGATIGAPGGVAPAPTGDLVEGITVPGATMAGVSAAAGPGATDGLADRTRVALDGAEFTSATRVLSDIRAGLDVTAHGPGTVTLAVTPDPGPALERMQGLVDAVAQVAAVAGPQGASSIPAAPTPAGAAAPAMTAASMWSSISSAASSFASSFASATPAAGPPAGDPTQALGAVAAPLVAAVGAAFVDASGRPLIPGTTVQQGRVSLDREAFAREYVRDAVGVEGAIASVARSVASTSDAASDPRVGALAVRIQSELHQDAEYTIDETGGQRLDARQEELDRRAVALQTLLERLESESSWLGGQLR